ncbi:MAG: KAP family NTPase [Duncaniella sp.]|nr:KAP family NTPase [Duncaniella sp.]
MEPGKKTSISDIPLCDVTNDFGTERYVNGLVKFIQNSSAPITIALQGEWGSGKTSLMNKLEYALCGTTGEFEGITINTWEYSMLSSPEVTVIKILRKLIAALTHPTLKEKAAKYFGALRAPVKAVLGAATHGISNGVGVGDVVDDWFDRISNQPSDLEQLKQVLEDSIIKTLSQPNVRKKGVIVFIDDLDRLNPPVAVEILELLKNIFSLKNCIFILAIDYEVVVKGLEPKFGKLTERNEREFRSFFDKIIQVPFSLPVSNYRPMDFVLASLADIGYISSTDASRENAILVESLTTIVESSVGKNPRSIKRLINTLSLLDCIAQCGNEDDQFSKSPQAKIVNFAVVAIQVCYPKIYRMLAYQPDFLKWDADMASRMNIRIPETVSNDDDDDSADEYEVILDAVCETDPYLSQRRRDINKLFKLVQQTLALTESHDDSGLDFGEQMRKITDKSSVTGINTDLGTIEFNSAEFVKKLQSNVMKRVEALRPDIKKWDFRKVFKFNGGIKFRKNSKLWRETVVKFETGQENNVTRCDIVLDLSLNKPERMRGLTDEEIFSDEKFGSLLSRLDETIGSAMKHWFVKGPHVDDATFDNYSEYLRFLYDHDWADGKLSVDAKYNISFDRASKFEQPEVIDLIAELVIANYDFQTAAGDL